MGGLNTDALRDGYKKIDPAKITFLIPRSNYQSGI